MQLLFKLRHHVACFLTESFGKWGRQMGVGIFRVNFFYFIFYRFLEHFPHVAVRRPAGAFQWARLFFLRKRVGVAGGSVDEFQLVL